MYPMVWRFDIVQGASLHKKVHKRGVHKKIHKRGVCVCTKRFTKDLILFREYSFHKKVHKRGVQKRFTKEVFVGGSKLIFL